MNSFSSFRSSVFELSIPISCIILLCFLAIDKYGNRRHQEMQIDNQNYNMHFACYAKRKATTSLVRCIGEKLLRQLPCLHAQPPELRESLAPKLVPSPPAKTRNVSSFVRVRCNSQQWHIHSWHSRFVIVDLMMGHYCAVPLCCSSISCPTGCSRGDKEEYAARTEEDATTSEAEVSRDEFRNTWEWVQLLSSINFFVRSIIMESCTLSLYIMDMYNTPSRIFGVLWNSFPIS